ncbi:MAG: hypothetical protein DUD27_09235, partial [Lachnospiraceae bacterium]
MNHNLTYAIYGINRVSKDFLYIFDKLNISLAFASKNETPKDFNRIISAPIISENEITGNRNKFDAIIVCDFDKSAKTKFLDKLGYKYGKDYFYEEDFFDVLDDSVLNPEKKPILIWGAGRKGEAFIRWNKWFDVEKVIDSNPKEEKLFGYQIVKPNDIIDWKDYFIIVTVVKNDDIINFLESKGLVYNKDYCKFYDFMSYPSMMLRQTIFEKKVYDFNCNTMLNHAEIGSQGNTICCCSTFIDNSLGYIVNTHKFHALWNSNIHKIMCLSNVNRTYSFCRTDMCPLFVGRHLSEQYNLAEPYPRFENSPNTVLVGFDYTCNLKCITCRSDYRFARDEDQRKIQGIADTFRK